MTMLELDLIFYSKLLFHLQKMRLLNFSCVLTSTLMNKW